MGTYTRYVHSECPFAEQHEPRAASIWHCNNMVKIGLQNAYRSRMKKSLGLSCIVNWVYVSPSILYPKFCWVIKGNRGGYFETGGGGHLKLTSDYRGGMFNGGGVI